MTEWFHAGINTYLRKKTKKIEPLGRPYKLHPNDVGRILFGFLSCECITDISEFTTLVQACSDLKNGNWDSLHFRGDSKDWKETKKFSTYFRDKSAVPNPALEMNEIRDFQATKTGEYLMSRFEQAGEKDPSEHPWWWLLTQHHSEEGYESSLERGYRTRLLDVTQNPFVALYFACNSSDDEDGIVYIFLDLHHRSIVLPTPGQPVPDDGFLRYRTLEEYIRDDHNLYTVDVLARIDYSKLSLAYELVKRLVAQSGEFLMQTERKSERARIQAWTIPVCMDSKQELLKQLSKLLNVSDSSLMVKGIP